MYEQDTFLSYCMAGPAPAFESGECRRYQHIFSLWTGWQHDFFCQILGMDYNGTDCRSHANRMKRQCWMERASLILSYFAPCVSAAVCKHNCVRNSLQLLLKPHFLLFSYLMVWLRPHTDYKVCYDTWLLLLIDLWFTSTTEFLPNFLQLIYSREEQVGGLFSLGNEFSSHCLSRFSRWQSCASFTCCKDRNGFLFKYVYLSLAKPSIEDLHGPAINHKLC